MITLPTAWVIGTLTVKTGEFTVGIDAMCANAFTGLLMFVLIVAEMEVVAASKSIGLVTDVRLEPVRDTKVSIATFVSILIDALPRTADGAVSATDVLAELNEIAVVT